MLEISNPILRDIWLCFFGDLTTGTPYNQFKIYRRNRECRRKIRIQRTYQSYKNLKTKENSEKLKETRKKHKKLKNANKSFKNTQKKTRKNKKMLEKAKTKSHSWAAEGHSLQELFLNMLECSCLACLAFFSFFLSSQHPRPVS